jgi:hypothetical protein
MYKFHFIHEQWIKYMLVYFCVPLAEPGTFRNRHFYVILNPFLVLEGTYG